MKANKRNVIVAAALVGLCAGAYALWQNSKAATAQNQARKVLFYQDSMHPWIKSEQPGKCTICAMDLTPIYQGEQSFGSARDVIALNPTSVTVLNVQAAEVQVRPLHRTLRVAGNLEADNTRKAVIAAPAPGRIDNVAVASAGVEVKHKQALATFYSPDLTFQTRRYIFRDRLPDRTNEFGPNPFPMVGSSRHALAHPSPVSPRTDLDPFYNDLLSPLAGTVVERNVFDGQYVAEGDRLFTIVDCSVLWFRFDVYEQQLPWLEPGQKVEVTVPAIPGRVFPAVISIIEPTLNDATRTVKVRADVSNPLVGTPERQHRLLRLGMYAEGRVRAQVPEALIVPRSAILFPGGQAYAYVDKNGGAYEMRRVKLGRQGDEDWEILGGLDQGERVVTAGNVLIDAQAQFAQSTSPDDAEEEATARTGGTPVLGAGLSEAQHKPLADFLAVADGISSALASDNLEQVKLHASSLAATVSPLVKEFGTDHPWQAVLKRIQASSQWPPPADLKEARKSFLPFSTNVVELVQRLRSEAAAFGSLKVYFCPMAPKPGLWFQAQGPLRNPYYGAMMLSCGEEVRAPAATHKALSSNEPKSSAHSAAMPEAASTGAKHGDTGHLMDAAPTQTATSRRNVANGQTAAAMRARFTALATGGSGTNPPAATK